MAEDEHEVAANVVVAVRCRPMSQKETNESATQCVEFPSSQQVCLKIESETHQFAFDHIFSSKSSQDSVFEQIGIPLLNKAFEGFNSTVFAYGQTGSGKTHTMLAHRAAPDQRGLVPRISDSLYNRIQTLTQEFETRRFLVCCSFLEIYNEIIYDLLVPRSKQNKGGLEVREQKGIGVYVKDLTEMVVESSERLNHIIEQGFEHRSTAATKMNDASSRSHCIFIIKLHQKDAEDGAKNTFSKLNLVDLAGSERAKSTEAEGDRLKEGANINKSLSALGNVINALSSVANGNKKIFVPYRNSKLTRVLQESLGGNSLCTMVATISPSNTNAVETLSTLNYAKRAKMIKVTATKNDEASQVKKLEEEVQALRRKLEQQAGSGAVMGAAEKAEMESKYGAQIEELQSFMKQSWEEKAQLSKQYEQEQQRAREEAQRAAERVRGEKQRRLQLLEQTGDIQRTLQDLEILNSSLCRGWPEKIGESLRFEQQLHAQINAVKLYRESAATDFQMLEQVSDDAARQTLLSGLKAKLTSMSKELEVLKKLELQLDEQMGRVAPQVALAARQAAERRDGGDSEEELAELMALVQRQLSQRHAKARSNVCKNLQNMGLSTETDWLVICLTTEGFEETGERTAMVEALRSREREANGTRPPSTQAEAEEDSSPDSGPPGVLGLSTSELPDSRITSSSNSEATSCARLLQALTFGGWCPISDSHEEYLEVDMVEDRRVTGVSLQGRTPCSSEWTQTRDLLCLALAEMADKLPTQEKIWRRPPVRLIHDMGVILVQDRKCMQPLGINWQVPDDLLSYPDLSRDQKLQFFGDLIAHTNEALQQLARDGSVEELKVTASDMLKGNNCEETNRFLQVLAYLGLRAQRPDFGGGLFDISPQWTRRWKLSYFTERDGWAWYSTGPEPHTFEGNADAVGEHFVQLPESLSASKLRIHPLEWQRHPALRCEVHVVTKVKGALGVAHRTSITSKTGGSLYDWAKCLCEGISELQRALEDKKQAKLKEEAEQAAAVSSAKDKAEQERDVLQQLLKDAQRRVEELEAQRAATEERAVNAETELLKMKVENDRLCSKVDSLVNDLQATREAKAAAEEQCASFREECDEYRSASEDLLAQLQVMTEERDLARSKEEELFDMMGMKDEELMDTNNGYVYLTERLQEKEEEMEQLQEQMQVLQESNETLDERCKELSDQSVTLLSDQKRLKARLAEEERAAKASQDRYMKLIKGGIGGTTISSNRPDSAGRTTIGSPDTTQSTARAEKAEGDGNGENYEDDFDEDEGE